MTSELADGTVDLDAMTEVLAERDELIDNIESKVKDLDERVGGLERLDSRCDERWALYRREYQGLREDIEDLDATLTESDEEFRQFLLAHDRHDARLAALEQQVAHLAAEAVSLRAALCRRAGE